MPLTAQRRRQATRSGFPTNEATARSRAESEQARWEHILEGVIDDLFAMQLSAIVTAMGEAEAETLSAEFQAHIELIAEAIRDGYFSPQWKAALLPHIEDIVAVGGDGVSGSVGLSFNLRAPNVMDAIEGRLDTLAGYVGETTANGILRELKASIEAGEGTGALATRLRQNVLDTGDASRASTIARTEVNTAYATGQHWAAVDSGVIQSKTWLTQGDDLVRDSHAELDGVTIGLDEIFDNGCLYPCDPDADPSETINCRCVLLYQSEES